VKITLQPLLSGEETEEIAYLYGGWAHAMHPSAPGNKPPVEARSLIPEQPTLADKAHLPRGRLKRALYRDVHLEPHGKKLGVFRAQVQGKGFAREELVLVYCRGAPNP